MCIAQLLSVQKTHLGSVGWTLGYSGSQINIIQKKHNRETWLELDVPDVCKSSSANWALDERPPLLAWHSHFWFHNFRLLSGTFWVALANGCATHSAKSNWALDEHWALSSPLCLQQACSQNGSQPEMWHLPPSPRSPYWPFGSPAERAVSEQWASRNWSCVGHMTIGKLQAKERFNSLQQKRFTVENVLSGGKDQITSSNRSFSACYCVYSFHPALKRNMVAMLVT